MDVARLRESFAHVAVHGDELPLFFYSDLFLRHPEVRECSPSRWRHRHLAGELAKIVSQSDNADDLTTFLEGLGRDHRKFGVVAEHYDAGAPEPAGDLGTFLGAGLDERSVCFLARLSRATRPWRSGSLTSAPTPARGAGRRGGRGSPGQEPARSPGRPSMRRSSAPACSIMSTPRSPSTATPRRSPGCCTGSTSRGPSRPPANPVHQRRIHARVHHRTRPRDAVRLRTGAAPAADGPGRAREPGRTAIRATAGAGDRRPGTGHRCGADRRVGRCRGRAGAGFSRLPAAKAIRAMIRAATAGTAVTSAVMAQLRQGQG